MRQGLQGADHVDVAVSPGSPFTSDSVAQSISLITRTALDTSAELCFLVAVPLSGFSLLLHLTVSFDDDTILL